MSRVLGKGPGQIINEKKGIYHEGPTLEKQIERLEGNLGWGRNRILNEITLKRLKKMLQVAKEGTVNNKIYNQKGNDGDNEPLDIESWSRNSQGARIYDNVLHRFATYNTLFTLSGINEKELMDHSFITNTAHDVIARSGGIGDPKLTPFSDKGLNPHETKNLSDKHDRVKNAKEVLKAGRDIFFEDVNLLSTVGPSEERGMADFVKMTFKLHEPYGISFVERVRASATLNGYRDHLDAPLLLTIEFKGFDEKGFEYKKYGQQGILIRKIPILITRVDMDVNEGGAIYDVTAVRHQDLAFDDRFKFPRTAISFTASTLRGATEQMAKKINESIKKERDEHKVREVLDQYIIEVDPEVENISKDYSNTADSVNNYVHPRSTKSNKKQILELDVAETTITSLVSITKLLEDLVRSTNGYEDLATDFWTAYLRRVGFLGDRADATKEKIKEFYESGKFEKTITENAFVPWFKIKTSCETDYSQFDNINKMHRKIITFKIIPHQIPVLKFIRPGVFAKAETMRGAVKKQYNYLYTGANTDVQNLRINYKTAYYMRNTIAVHKGNSGLWEKVDNIISRVFGKENTENKDVATLRSYPSIIRGRNILQTGKKDTGKEGAKQDFYDYLTNPTVDMMRIEMEILGDPAYICQDQFIPLNGSQQQNNSGGAYDPYQGCFNADNYSPLIELVYALPDDVNDKQTGLMFDQNSQLPEENLFFAGIYQVVKIESSIANGQFLQTLTCVRLNNQSGLGEDVQKIVKKGAGKFIDALKPDDIKKKADKVIDSNQKTRRRYLRRREKKNQ